MGTPHATWPNSSASAAPASIGTSPTTPRKPPVGEGHAASPRGGGIDHLLTPGGGIDQPVHPRRGCGHPAHPRRGYRQPGSVTRGAESLHDFKIRQLPLVPTCQWVKGDIA